MHKRICHLSLLMMALMLAAGLVSCGKRSIAAELLAIDSITDSISSANTPADHALFLKADSLLRGVDTLRLSANDRMYLSLLRVKATDKAYLPHPGDSVIRPVVEYAENHKCCGFLPEALYYAGRVYSDMGDSFTALRYYQDALDNVSDGETDRNLRCRILSQTASLLNSLRLYKEAIPYLEECIALNKINKDSVNLFFNHQNLSAIKLHLKEYDKAEYCIEESLKYSDAVSKDDSLISIAYLAGIKEAKNEMDSALSIIRGIPGQVSDSLTRNMALAYASDIYRKSGQNDTALIYARELIRNGNPNNKIIGYQNILKPDNLAATPVDSLIYCVRAYAEELNRDLDANGDKLAIIQQAQYNYSLHDRMRREEEEKAKELRIAVGIGIVLIFFSLIVITVLFWKRKKDMKALLNSVNQIKELTERIASMESVLTDDIKCLVFSNNTDSDADAKRKLMDELKTQILALAEKWIAKGEDYKPIEMILKSQAYKNVVDRIGEKKKIEMNDEIWKKLDRIVGKCYPGFKKRLQSLTGRNFSINDYHLAMLIKCGFSPTEIASVYALSVSAISQQRSKLGERMFGRSLPTAIVDAVIQVL